MDLYQCEARAKEIGFDKAVFDAHFSVGKVRCQWVDAYFGIFKADIPGFDDGFLMVKEIYKMFPDLVCENLHVPEDTV